LRIDIAERVARTGHEAIAANRAYEATEPHVVSIGLPPEAFADLMRQAGFRLVESPAEGAANWVFRGRPKARPPRGPRSDHRRPARTEDGTPAQRPRRPERSGDQRGGERGDRSERGERPNRPDRSDRPDRGERREPRQPAPVGSATAKALSGLADLLKRDG
jgi:ATP-dependent RNA helicase SUPV3L1/SUV3